MDDFQENEDQTDKPKSTHRLNLGWVWDLFSILLLIATCAISVIVVLIFNNPASPINPFPPPTPVPALLIPSLTPWPTQLPSITPTVTPSPSPTATATPLPPPTQTAIVATPVGPEQATVTATQRSSTSLFSFNVQGEPRAIESSLFNPGRACKWMGVAGQVFDLKNSPVPLGIIVQLAGVVDGKVLNITSLTGTATQYGPAGYEITLAERTAASTGQLWIRLLNQEGIPLSDRVVFDTYSDCNKNLIIINFKQVK